MADAPPPPWNLGCPWCPFRIVVNARGARGSDQGSGVEAAEVMKLHALRHGYTWQAFLAARGDADVVGLVIGDELLVDGSAYTGAGVEWGRLEHVAPGSASVYPYKVRLSNGAQGQYKARELLGRRRPEELEAAISESDAAHPGARAALEENAKWPR